MVNFSIAGKEYKAFHEWSEMPLSFAVELMSIINDNIPEPLRDYYKGIAYANEEQIKSFTEEWSKGLVPEYNIKIIPEFQGLIMKKLSDCPQEVIDKLLAGYRNEFYKRYCENFVFGLLHYPVDYQYQHIDSFKHKGVTYFLPVERDILGKRPMADTSAIEFSESADLHLQSNELASGKYSHAANIISILCRPKFFDMPKEGQKDLATIKKVAKAAPKDFLKIEHYNEQICLDRAKEFLDLKMDVVHEVFFCLLQRLTSSLNDTVISFLEGELAKQKQENQEDFNPSVGTEV